MYMTHACYTENTKGYDLAIRKPHDMVFTYLGELVSCENSFVNILYNHHF